MKIDVVELNATTGVFDVRDVTPSFLNAIRRTMLSEVPKMAIDDVTIYDNTSALFDEMVAHRLGLLPVPTDLNLFVPRAQCTCNGEGCPNCTILFTLSKEGPCTVYSGDLTPAADQKFRIVDPKVPIVKLLEGQRVMLEAGAVMGHGTMHAKWVAVTAVGYQEYPTVKVGAGGILPATIEKMQKNAPADAIAFEGNSIRILNPIKAATYLRSVAPLYDLDNVHVGTEKDRYVFTVETDGSLSPVTAIRKAISIVMEKLKEVEAEVPKLKMPEVSA